VGLTDEDIGRIEFFQFGAATGNSIATLMWFTVHVFSDPSIVERMRAELLPLVQETSTPSSGHKQITLNLASIEENCPFLLASWKETLRLINVHTSVRRVLEDTYVSDGPGGTQYLLKKGHDVVIPHVIAHRYDIKAWGPEQESMVFRPENFLPSSSEEAKGLDKARRAAWVPFGGGANLCPGRRIVMIEQLAFMATLVLGFEVEALSGEGGIKAPETMPMGLGHAILRPAEKAEVGVRLNRRAGWEDVMWGYELGKTTRQAL
jgi:cytochrome P450